MNFLKNHKYFFILLFILSVYLGLKTFPENGWGGWYDGIGDAQTLLSSKHWANDGFFYSKFLAIPIGYSKITRYLDEPEMRHHAKGTVTGGLIGKRLYYTHYPSGYSVPYALLMKSGAEQRHWFRLLALAISIGSLFLIYWFFNIISGSKKIAFFGALYYATSTMFLSYADSLANQPVDDLFRFGVMIASALAYRHISDQARHKKFLLLAWVLYFLLSISSYDSTLSIFVWLVGIDIIYERKFLWKKWLIYLSAPVLAFSFQMLQNWWYLGSWRDVWLDSFGASRAKFQTGDIGRHFADVFYTLNLMTGIKTLWAVLVVFALIFFSWKTKVLDKINKGYSLLAVLFLAGAAYPFIFVGSGGFSYQGRQMAPFVSLLASAGIAYIFYLLREADMKKLAKNLPLIFCLALLWAVQAGRTANYVYDWPNTKADGKIIRLSKEIKSMKSGDSALFYLGGKTNLNSVAEYYLDMPVLQFSALTDMANDYIWLKSRTKYPFDAFVMADNKESAEAAKKFFDDKTEDNKEKIRLIEGQYIFKVPFSKL